MPEFCQDAKRAALGIYTFFNNTESFDQLTGIFGTRHCVIDAFQLPFFQ
ncbi:MAG: hypothetical protein IPI91_17205 [Flavobacteriales bacterium]|nr:hypothetical protein [Flavobacteriales bacterium]